MTVKERQLRIAGVLSNVSSACDFVVEQAREAGLDERAIHHCYLAVDEACTNIIEHGYPQPCGECVIDIFCRRDDHTLTISVIDDSPAFDPLLHPDPDPALPLNERTIGGWGIFFIKKLMDSVSYTHEGGRNRLILVMNLDRPAKSPTSTYEMPAFKPIDIRALTEKIWVVTPSGRLDQAQAAYLASVVNSQLESGHRWLIVNMAAVEFISSAGLKMLVSVWQRVRDQKGDLALAALNPRVREVLEMIGLDLVFTISDSPDKAGAQLTLKVK